MGRRTHCATLICLCICYAAANRRISIDYNPGCDVSSCSNKNLSVNVVYARLEGDKDCLHYIFSTVGPSLPTLLLLHSKHNSSRVTFNWKELLSLPLNSTSISGATRLVDHGGKSFSDSPTTALYLFHQVLEYRDVENNANIYDPKNDNVTTISMNELSWNITIDRLTIQFIGTNRSPSQSFTSHSWLEIKFNFYETEGRDPKPPRLPYNKLSAELDFTVNNLTANYSNSRYALLVVVANPGNSSFVTPAIVSVKNAGDVSKLSVKSIDDEYAPSIFTLTQLMWKPRYNKSLDSNFWAWRTVCYTQFTRSRKYSTDVTSTFLQAVNESVTSQLLKTNRLTLSYFGDENAKTITFKNMFVNFGKTDDGYYNATKYITWTSIIGFGSPPKDSFSLTVICILFVGVGCPVLVLVVGGIYLCLRKYKKYKRTYKFRAEYEEIN